MVYFTSSEWKEAGLSPRSTETDSLKRLAGATLATAYAQLIAGAIVRHTHGHGLNIHYVGAFLIVVHLFLMQVRIQRNEKLSKTLSSHALLCLGVSIIQISLGFGSFVYRIVLHEQTIRPTAQILFTTAHQTTGAVLLALILVLTLRVFRLTRSK